MGTLGFARLKSMCQYIQPANVQDAGPTYMNPSIKSLNNASKSNACDISMPSAWMRVHTEGILGKSRETEAMPLLLSASRARAKAAESTVMYTWLTGRSGQSCPTETTFAPGRFAFFSGGVTTPSAWCPRLAECVGQMQVH